MQKIGKKAKALELSGIFVVGAIILVIAALIFAQDIRKLVIKESGAALSGAGSPTNNAATGNAIVTTATTVTATITNALQPGTTLSGVTRGSPAGGPYTTTLSFTPGSSVQFIANSSGYHDQIFGPVVVSGTNYPLTMALKQNSTMSLRVFNTNNALLSNGAGGATNQTMTTGSSANLITYMDGVALQSTQDMVCILEASNGNLVDTLTLSGFGAKYQGRSKPSSYTLAGANSAIWVYEVDAVEGAVSPQGTIGVTSRSNQGTSASYMIIECRSKEHFVDPTDGQLRYDIEDSLGVARNLARYIYTVYFQ